MRTVCLKLEIPKELQDEKYCEINKLEFSKDCVSYFWKRSFDKCKSEAMLKTSKRNIPKIETKAYSTKTVFF